MNRFIAILFTGILISCNSKTDLVTEEKEIRNLLQQERKAHFERNVDLFISEFADSVIFVNKGTVKLPTPEENKTQFDKYFGSVQFIKWDDMAEPLIRFSDDGSLAYAVVQKKVIVTYPDITGKAFYDTTHYAWASVYRKQKGKWKVEVNVSTNK